MSLNDLQKRVLQGIVTKIRPQFLKDCTGHDWFHIERVVKMAQHIQSKEGGNYFIVTAAAYLHDVSDHKFNGGLEDAGGKVSRAILMELGCPEEDIAAITYIIDNVSYKGAGVADKEMPLEGLIVRDADRLDAIGATGIARTFAYGGNRGHGIYDSDVPPVSHTSFEQYAKGATHTINHFYEKLLLLKKRMGTQEGRRIAEERHAFMVVYLKQFMGEWDISGQHAGPVPLEQFD